MTWKFWKKDEHKYEHETTTNAVPYSTLYRWVCYDLGVTDPDSLDRKLGLTPISEDAKDMERTESKKRMAPVEGLFPFIELLANINSEIAVETNVSELFKKAGFEEDSEELEVMKDAMSILHTWTSFAGIATAFAIANELGIISVIPTTTAEVKEYDIK